MGYTVFHITISIHRKQKKSRTPNKLHHKTLSRLVNGHLSQQKGVIGETGRSLGKRITEHKYAVKMGDQKNGVAVHAWDEGHRVDWEGAKILESEPHYLKRRVLESIWIKKTSRNSNLDCGLVLNQTWLPYFE